MMADDYGQKIHIDITSAPKLTDEELKSNHRYVLGYLTAVFSIDEDATLYLYAARNETMEYDLIDTFTLKKENKRYRRKVKLSGSVLNWYAQLVGDFKEFEITTCRISRKLITTGKI